MTARKHCSPNLMHSSAAMQEGMSAISLRRVTLEAHLHSQAGDDTVAYQGLPEHPAYQWTQLVPHCDFHTGAFSLKCHAPGALSNWPLLTHMCLHIWSCMHKYAFKLSICFQLFAFKFDALSTLVLSNWKFALNVHFPVWRLTQERS
jgi:hypothetical protein